MNRTNKNETLVAATTNDPRWAAVVARDPDADGKFFYSVRTTGVYCARPARPAWPGRKMLRSISQRPTPNGRVFVRASDANRSRLR
jgi:Metal binding domain of Ada